MTEKSAAFCKKSKYSVVDLLGQKNPHSSKSGSGTVQLNKLFFFLAQVDVTSSSTFIAVQW